MTTTTRGLLTLFAIASLPIACDGGCGGSGAAPAASVSASASAPPSVAQAQSSASASGSSGRRRNMAVRMTGAAGTIFRAVQSMDLKPEQKTALDTITAELRDTDGDAGAPRADMMELEGELVAGVKAGKLDASKLDAHVATMEKASKARAEQEAAALNKVHATLDGAQRKAVVESVRASEEKRAARMRAHDGGRVDFARARLEHQVKDLDLDAEQQKKVQALYPKDDGKDPRAEAKTQLDGALAAFEKDSFDAKKLDLGDAKARTKPVAESMKFFAGLVPILRPEQREKLAARLQKGDHGPREGREGGGRMGVDRHPGSRDEDDERDPH